MANVNRKRLKPGDAPQSATEGFISLFGNARSFRDAAPPSIVQDALQQLEGVDTHGVAPILKEAMDAGEGTEAKPLAETQVFVTPSAKVAEASIPKKAQRKRSTPPNAPSV